jgi:hypothetical protein
VLLVAELLKRSARLKKIGLVSTKMNKTRLLPILDAAHSNPHENFRPCVDLSSNHLSKDCWRTMVATLQEASGTIIASAPGSTAAHGSTDALRRVMNYEQLMLRECGLGLEGLASLAEAMALGALPHLHVLAISCNVAPSTDLMNKKAKQRLQKALAALLQPVSAKDSGALPPSMLHGSAQKVWKQNQTLAPPIPLTHLYLTGDSKTHLKEQLVPILEAMHTNEVLQVLDISGNRGGVKVLKAIGSMLQSNTQLQQLHFDKNNTTVDGIEAVRIGMDSNYTMLNLCVPQSDVVRLDKSRLNANEQQHLINALTGIQECMLRNLTAHHEEDAAHFPRASKFGGPAAASQEDVRAHAKQMASKTKLKASRATTTGVVDLDTDVTGVKDRGAAGTLAGDGEDDGIGVGGKDVEYNEEEDEEAEAGDDVSISLLYMGGDLASNKNNLKRLLRRSIKPIQLTNSRLSSAPQRERLDVETDRDGPQARDRMMSVMYEDGDSEEEEDDVGGSQWTAAKKTTNNKSRMSHHPTFDDFKSAKSAREDEEGGGIAGVSALGQPTQRTTRTRSIAPPPGKMPPPPPKPEAPAGPEATFTGATMLPPPPQHVAMFGVLGVHDLAPAAPQAPAADPLVERRTRQSAYRKSITSLEVPPPMPSAMLGMTAPPPLPSSAAANAKAAPRRMMSRQSCRPAAPTAPLPEPPVSQDLDRQDSSTEVFGEVDDDSGASAAAAASAASAGGADKGEEGSAEAEAAELPAGVPPLPLISVAPPPLPAMPDDYHEKEAPPPLPRNRGQSLADAFINGIKGPSAAHPLAPTSEEQLYDSEDEDEDEGGDEGRNMGDLTEEGKPAGLKRDRSKSGLMRMASAMGNGIIPIMQGIAVRKGSNPKPKAEDAVGDSVAGSNKDNTKLEI